MYVVTYIDILSLKIRKKIYNFLYLLIIIIMTRANKQNMSRGQSKGKENF